jgi:hypothetical protein
MKRKFVEILFVVIAFIIIIVIFTRPMASGLHTDLPFPDLNGDGSVFVWNAWFMQQAFSTGSSPFMTSLIFYPSRAELSMHSMNWFNSALTAWLSRWLNLISAFNLVYLLSFLLTAMGMYLLLRQLDRSSIAAFAAALAFAFTPYVMAHGLGHFNLTSVFPIPWFFLFLLRFESSAAVSRKHFRNLIGIVAAFLAAFYTDFNYFLFCLIVLVVYMYVFRWKRSLGIEQRTQRKDLPKSIRYVQICIGLSLSAIVLISLTGGVNVSLGKIRISMNSVHNPLQMFWMFLFILLLLILFKKYRPVIRTRETGDRASMPIVQIGLAALLFIVFAWPLMGQIIRMIQEGNGVSPGIVWKSGFTGADMLSYVSLSPFHILWGKLGAAFSQHLPLSLSEKVLFPGFSIIGLAVFGYSVIPSTMKRFLTMTASLFFVLSLGQHLHIFGINTWLMLPFQVFKFLPFINNARIAARFGIIVIFALVVAATYGIDRLRDKRSFIPVSLIVALIVFEVLPAPFPMVRPEVPSVYTKLGNTRSDQSLLEIPFGRKDGLKGVGSFSPASMYWQTIHGKPLIGGYLARIPHNLLEDVRDDRVLSSIIQLQDGEVINPLDQSDVSRFRQNYNVGWVITHPGNRKRFHHFLTRQLGLVQIKRSGEYTLYTW